MKIFITGNTQILSRDFLTALSENDNKVLWTEFKDNFKHIKNLYTYDYAEYSDAYEKLFATYNFDTMICISQSLNSTKRIYNELESLENNLYLCKKYGVKNIIYITSNDYIYYKNQRDSSSYKLNSSRYLALDACNKMFKKSIDDWAVDITIIRTPYIYSINHSTTYINELIKDAVRSNELTIIPPKDWSTDFICDQDLGILTSRILDNMFKGYFEMNISGNNPHTFDVIFNFIQEKKPTSTLKSRNGLVGIPSYVDDGKALEEYNFKPSHKIEEDLNLMWSKYETAYHKAQKKKLKSRKMNKSTSTIIKFIEIILLMLLANYLNIKTADNYLINFIDFRIVFIVIVGSVYGFMYGTLAAVLASVSFISTFVTPYNWQSVFYNVENWFPFATYFLLGATTGYTSERLNEKIRFTEKRRLLIERKYVYLVELYNEALKNKASLVNQILGYQDSYGKIYDVVEKINSIDKNNIFKEAIRIMSDFLECTYVIIYKVSKSENNKIANLIEASKKIDVNKYKEIILNDYPEIYVKLSKNETYVNKTNKLNYPAYVFPIYKNKVLTNIIVLTEVNDTNMNMNYLNKFNIVSSLIEDSLTKTCTIDFNDADNIVSDAKKAMEGDEYE